VKEVVGTGGEEKREVDTRGVEPQNTKTEVLEAFQRQSVSNCFFVGFGQRPCSSFIRTLPQWCFNKSRLVIPELQDAVFTCSTLIASKPAHRWQSSTSSIGIGFGMAEHDAEMGHQRLRSGRRTFAFVAARYQT
jgi:hypothetical protein